jgi:hypothetical protein
MCQAYILRWQSDHHSHAYKRLAGDGYVVFLLNPATSDICLFDSCNQYVRMANGVLQSSNARPGCRRSITIVRNVGNQRIDSTQINRLWARGGEHFLGPSTVVPLIINSVRGQYHRTFTLSLAYCGNIRSGYGHRGFS